MSGAKRPYRWWTTTEHRLIMQHWDTLSNKEIAHLLNRTEDQLERYTRQNKIYRTQEYITKRNKNNAKSCQQSKEN